ncbi:MAG: 2-dehydropantoate 2-reductase, partial [Anaerolineales bacterium]|nr:2-dehydropantoate 2-reductase [Anaerolineales bacterium]
WKAGLEALHSKGARIVNADGTESAYKVHATDDPRECKDVKHALVLVKAWQTETIANQLKECLAEDGLAVTLQNGLGNYETLTRSLGPARVAIGVTTTGATLLGPGSVRAGGEGIISMERHQAIGPMEEALKSAGFNLQLVDDAQSLVWGKLVVNAAINPLTALLDVPNGELLKRPSAREAMSALALEVADVAAAEHIRLPFDDPVKATEDVARKTAANHSSMLQDIRRGAPTEINAICGAVVEIGKRHNVETPANWVCWHLVKAMAQAK